MITPTFDPATQVQRTERFDLRALYETSRVLSASLDLDFVLNNLLLTAMSKLLVTRGVVLLFDPLTGDHRVAMSKGMPDLKVDDRIDLAALANDKVLRAEEVPEVLQAHRVALVLPIRSAYRDIGMIALGPKATAQRFEGREIEFMQSLVNMCSAAVHNSLMVEELRTANRDLDGRVQQLNTLFDLSQSFNGTLDRGQVVKQLSFALMGQLLVQKYLFLLSRGQNGNESGAGPRVDLQVVDARGVDMDLEPDLIHRLCGLKEVVNLADGDAQEDWDGLARRGLTVALPLQQHGRTCGVLCLGPKMTRQPYSQVDLEFLYALGNLAVVSIQNSILVEERIEKERLEEELRLARHIQERLLPQTLPDYEDVDIAALALPSRMVGGDYYDAIPLADERVLFAVADVTGKGMPAALLMANLQASLHILVPIQMTIEEATTHINRVMCENTDYDKFITYFHGILHRRTGVFHYVNAGHNPPVLIRADGSVELLETGGLLLGIMQSLRYDRGIVQLDPGDVLVMFTDGVTEAMSPESEEYGDDRLLAVIQKHRDGTAREIMEAIDTDIRVFTRDPALLSDDLTMLVVKLRGRSE